MDNNLTRKQKFVVVLAVIVAITLSWTIAAMKGIDGQVFTAAVGALTGIGGWSIRAIKTG